MLKDSSARSHVRCWVKGRNKEIQRLKRNSWENSPTKEKSFPYYWREGGYINSRPLFRYLNSMIGEPWKDVYSRIPKKLLPSLDWMVRKDVMEVAPEKFTTPNNSWYCGFFIKEGILRALPSQAYVKQKKVKLPSNIKLVNKYLNWVQKTTSVEITLKRQVYSKTLDGCPFWFLKVLQYYRDTFKWDPKKMKPIAVGKEPVFNLLQVSGKLQRCLDEIWSKYSAYIYRGKQ